MKLTDEYLDTLPKEEYYEYKFYETLATLTPEDFEGLEKYIKEFE